jgi:hypothetical protein
VSSFDESTFFTIKYTIVHIRDGSPHVSPESPHSGQPTATENSPKRGSGT